MVKKYKIAVAYDGTGYAGWQRQEEQRTVTGTLEHVFLLQYGCWV